MVNFLELRSYQLYLLTPYPPRYCMLSIQLLPCMNTSTKNECDSDVSASIMAQAHGEISTQH